MPNNSLLHLQKHLFGPHVWRRIHGQLPNTNFTLEINSRSFNLSMTMQKRVISGPETVVNCLNALEPVKMEGPCKNVLNS